MAYCFDHKTNLKPLNLQFRQKTKNFTSKRLVTTWTMPQADFLTIPQTIDKMKTKGSNENPNLRPYFAWNQQSFADSTFFEYVAALINLVTCLRHQKTKPRIHQFTNLKCCIKAREPSKPLFNGLSFLIHYFKRHFNPFFSIELEFA